MSPRLSFFFNTCFDYFSFVLVPVGESIKWSSARRVVLWPTHLTEYEPKPLIEISSEHTPTNLFWRKRSLDKNLDYHATTVDALEVNDTTDVRRLISPFHWARWKFFPILCFFFSQIDDKSRRSFGKLLSNVERKFDLEWSRLWKENGKDSLSATRQLQYFCERHAETPSQTRLLNMCKWRVQNAPICRDSVDNRHCWPNPEHLFNNDVPNRLLEQTHHCPRITLRNKIHKGHLPP